MAFGNNFTQNELFIIITFFRRFMLLNLERAGFVIINFLFFFSLTFCQGVAIGQWREHLPYHNVIDVVQDNDNIYAATQYAIIKYNKNDFSIERYSKINILSDVGISCIDFHKKLKTLIVCYENGNIDLIKSGKKTNVSDIKRSNISENKRINNILIKDNFAYLSCNFGIVLFDLLKQEVKETYIIGKNGSMVEVYDVEFYDNKIYAATSEGLKYAFLNNSNLNDYNNWFLDDRISRNNYYCKIIERFDNKLIACITKNVWATDTAFILEGNQWTFFADALTELKTSVKAYSNNLIISQAGGIFIFDKDLKEVTRIWSLGNEFAMPNDFVRDESDSTIFWIAESNLGLVKNVRVWNNEHIIPQGAFSTSIFSLSVANNSIIATPGTIDISWNNTYRKGGVYIFKDEKWINLHPGNIKAFDTIYDCLRAVANPQNPEHIFIASYGKGIVEIKENKIVEVWNGKNTSMSGTLNNPLDIRVSGMAFDKNNNLWVVTSYSSKCLHVRTINGEWHSFYIPYVTGGDVFANLLIDSHNNKWLINPRGGGIIVFNENGTFDNFTDDKYIKLTTNPGEGNLPSMRILSIAEDKDGKIWVGTDKGLAVFFYPQNIFTGRNFDAQQLLVKVGEHWEQLLESETINCIFIDGANRKWVGTEKAGAYLLSADGVKLIENFNEKNSPILSNAIYSIVVHPETGEVFFATAKGLVSYKGMATEGKETYDNNKDKKVYAYPNPVKSNYNGYIAVKNLVANSHIKLTDIYGNLIVEDVAYGGQFVWDGRLPDGKRPKTGVFLVWATNDDGTQTIVTKILFVE